MDQQQFRDFYAEPETHKLESWFAERPHRVSAVRKVVVPQELQRWVVELVSRFSAFSSDEVREILGAIADALSSFSADSALPDAFSDLDTRHISPSNSVRLTVEAIGRRLEFNRELISKSVGLAEAAAILGSSIPDANELIGKGELLAIPDDRGNFWVPRWQFDESRERIVPGLSRVLLQLRGVSPVEQAGWLTSASPYLGGSSPLSKLLEGEVEEVAQVARMSPRLSS